MEKESASSGLLPKLPIEVQEKIVDNLHDDRSALKSCALVCKSWLPVTRSHLFYSIEHKFDGVQDLSLIEFLRATTHILPYIRKLRLGGVVGAKVVFTLLHALGPNLVHVELQRSQIFEIFDEDIEDYLLSLLMLMPNLVQLRIHRLFARVSPTHLSTLRPAPLVTGFSKLSRLETLDPETGFTLRLWRARAAQVGTNPDAIPLRTLQVPITFSRSGLSETSEELRNLLRIVGKDLRHLIIDFAFRSKVSLPEIERELDAINLYTCAHLSVLEIHIKFDNPPAAEIDFVNAVQFWHGTALDPPVDPYTVASFISLASLVSRIPSTTIDHLIIEIQNPKVVSSSLASQCKASLEDLDGALCRFPKLNKITLRAASHIQDPWLAKKATNSKYTAVFDWIVENLPNVAQKGLTIGYAMEL